MIGEWERDWKAEAVTEERTKFVAPSNRVVDRFDFASQPEVLVGYVISVKWTDAWYDGVVLRYNAASERHLVRYNDGDEVWYNLSRKTHYVKGVAPPSQRTDGSETKRHDDDEARLPDKPTYEPALRPGQLSFAQRAARAAAAAPTPATSATARTADQ